MPLKKTCRLRKGVNKEQAEPGPRRDEGSKRNQDNHSMARSCHTTEVGCFKGMLQSGGGNNSVVSACSLSKWDYLCFVHIMSSLLLWLPTSGQLDKMTCFWKHTGATRGHVCACARLCLLFVCV